MNNTRKYGGLVGDTQPEVNRRKVVLLAALMALIVCGALWWLDRRPRRLRLVVGPEGCAAIEGTGLPVERAAEGSGCVVSAVLLPGTVFDSLTGPPHSMYRLRPPSDGPAVTETWLKKDLVQYIIYEADH